MKVTVYQSKEGTIQEDLFRSTAVKTSNIAQRTTFLYIYVSIYGIPWTRFDGMFLYLTKPPKRNAALFNNIFRLTSVSLHLWFLSTLSLTLSQHTIPRVFFWGAGRSVTIMFMTGQDGKSKGNNSHCRLQMGVSTKQDFQWLLMTGWY